VLKEAANTSHTQCYNSSSQPSLPTALEIPFEMEQLWTMVKDEGDGPCELWTMHSKSELGFDLVGVMFEDKAI